MAGHSHFKNIKRKKEAADQKKAVVFSKVSRLITAAVKEKGKDLQTNPSLRIAIEKAKEADMPKENIERAVRRGTGEGDEGKLESFIFEAYGPDDVAFIIEGSTDNKNRSLAEIKEVLKKHNSKLATPGSVKWIFEQKGIFEIELVDEILSLELIENGAEDIEETDTSLIIYVDPNNIENLKLFLLKKNINVFSSVLGWKPKTKIPLKNEDYRLLVEALESIESVENLYTNI